MRKSVIVLSLVFILFILQNCEYFTLMSNKEWLEKSGNNKVDVYACGYVGASMSHKVVYWKNNEAPVYLEAIANANSLANSIYVYKNDVYVAGCDSAGYPCYWINGEKKNLSYSGLGGAYDIAVQDDNVFIVGYDNLYAFLWINQEKFNLAAPPTSIYYLIAISLFVNKAGGGKYNIIIGGKYNDFAKDFPCYWTKNGSEIVVINTPNGSVKSLFLYKGDIYSAGDDGGSGYIWKNLDNLTSSITPTPSSLKSILISKDDMYIAGITSAGIAYYWKNYNSIQLPSSSSASSIKLFNNDVYVSGQGTVGYACYWINNTGPYYFNADGAGSSAIGDYNSLFVTWDTH